jgi:uridine kinase
MMPAPGNDRRAWVIGVAGPSGAGKSLVADLLAGDHPGDAIVLHADAYCRDQSATPWPDRADANMDHPDALEDRLLAGHIVDLRAGRPVESPQYDYSTFSRLPTTRRIHPRRLVIVEGILVLASEVVRHELDLGVYVDAPMDLCLHRRLLRDDSSRGLGVAHTLRQYPRTIRPMYERFVAPSIHHADVVVHNDGSPESLPDVLAGLRERVRARLTGDVPAQSGAGQAAGHG